ncbi:MAG: hypothetical protein J3K34DRAFT_19380 [Monoraphidium minutum]|nr:MAG: hypothetical protein J3K34DRAFT_19380 [Monoraphidium minutum]
MPLPARHELPCQHRAAGPLGRWAKGAVGSRCFSISRGRTGPKAGPAQSTGQGFASQGGEGWSKKASRYRQMAARGGGMGVCGGCFRHGRRSCHVAAWQRAGEVRRAKAGQPPLGQVAAQLAMGDGQRQGRRRYAKAGRNRGDGRSLGQAALVNPRRGRVGGEHA